MAINRFPGGLRIGVLDYKKTGVRNPRPQPVEPKFQLLLLLQGRHEFDIGGAQVRLDARHRPAAVLMRIRQSCTLRHLRAEGDPYRKIAIAADPDWISEIAGTALPDWPDDLPRAEAACQAHVWAPDEETVRLAAQIVAPPPQATEAETRLFRLSRGMELLRRAFAQQMLPQGAADPAAGRTGSTALAERIRLHILGHLNEDLSLERLERDLGLNRRSIQRHFRNVHGLTLRNFIRQERLMRARRALSEDGISVAQAAFLAGYSTTENFATAFRELFDITPHSLRDRSF